MFFRATSSSARWFLCLALLLFGTSSAMKSQDVTTLAGRVLDKNSKYEDFQALAKLMPKDERAFDALVRALREHRDWIHRSWAAQFFERAEEARAVEPLGAAAREDKNGEVRESAIRALGRINSAQSAATLARVFRETQKQTQRQAAETLGRMGSAEALAALDAATADPMAGPVAKAVLTQYDIRNKPQQTVDGTEVTLIGVQRTNKWSTTFGVASARKGAELAVVFFRLSRTQPGPDAPVIVEMQGADEKPVPRADGFTVQFFSADPAGRGQYFDIPFGVDAGRRPVSVKIQGAQFALDQVWR